MQPGRVLDAKVHALQSQRHCLLPEQLLQCPPLVLMLLLQGRAERPLPKEQPRWAALLAVRAQWVGELSQQERRQNVRHGPPEPLLVRPVHWGEMVHVLHARPGALLLSAAARRQQPVAREQRRQQVPWRPLAQWAGGMR
jgi:hypothetical protein